ncbi:hypothetical protein COY90_00170, partial [Candidatus Roizmanbacteria bacterium CG_4_10_14_0_8_um_filter_39_9]
MNKIISTNPGKNYEVVGEVFVTSSREITQKVYAANKAKKQWKVLGLDKRIKLLKPLVGLIEKRKEEIALTITQEMGKPIKESRDDVAWDMSYLKSFFELGAHYLQDEVTYSN